MSESPAGAPDPGSDPAGDAPPSELKRAISDPAPASASSREPSGKLMRSASMRRTPLARFASAGRKAGSMRLTMSQTLTKTRAKTDYRRDILSKPSEERTESDLLSLMEVFGRLRFAESLRHAEKVEVCKAMGFRSKRKGDTVFSQGDPGNTFYIVLSGSVSVSIRAGESESEEHVASLYNGDSFGELALLREGSVRSATVRAETDVEFLVISREDYNTILGAVTEEQLAEKIDFLIALPAFAGVPLSMIRSVAYVLTTREFDRNAVVFRQGEETEDIFFVERGGIKFVREVMDARALRRMGVHRDGPAAAARVAAREKGGFDATPPPPPGVDDVEAEMMDAFSHLTNTARRGPDSSGPASRPRTPTDPDDIFVSAASQARKAQEEKDSEEGPSAAKTAADGPLDAVAGDENATPAVAATENATVRPGNETETPQCSDTVGVNSPDGSFSTSAAPTPLQDAPRRAASRKARAADNRLRLNKDEMARRSLHLDGQSTTRVAMKRSTMASCTRWRSAV